MSDIPSISVVEHDPHWRTLFEQERDLLGSTLAPWLAGRVSDLYVCGRLGEGYDVPACARVVIHRETKSPIWIYQAVGRALRRHASKQHGEAYGILGSTADALWCALLLADSRRSDLFSEEKRETSQGAIANTHAAIAG